MDHPPISGISNIEDTRMDPVRLFLDVITNLVHISLDLRRGDMHQAETFT